MSSKAFSVSGITGIIKKILLHYIKNIFKYKETKNSITENRPTIIIFSVQLIEKSIDIFTVLSLIRDVIKFNFFFLQCGSINILCTEHNQ